MTDRSDLVRAIHAAGDGTSLARAVAALDDHDRARTASLQADRELDMGARLAARRLTPASLHEFHTAATDWLAEVPEGDGAFRTAMIAEASAWYGGLDQAVRSDDAELAEQARGRARTLASAHQPHSAAAAAEFLTVVAYLRSREGASGLPQIDQTTDANNQPAPTPYPTQVFPTFGEDQDEYNGVETDNHQSGISSQQAPQLQQVVQQNASGSGFGSGPEKPDEHATAFDTSNSYAEVPLGPPGQVPVAPGGTDQMASSHPNPVAGTQQDAGADRRQAAASLQDHSGPDPFGYRWPMTTVVESPFHERCASAHWPDQGCGGRQHTASVAIGYQMNLDQARRRAQCEEVGVREGLRAISSAGGPAELGAHHNRVAQAWNGSGQTADDTAVLHGFMAVVRPVLAEMAVQGSGQCEACRGGDCGQCAGTGCSCGHGGRKAGARAVAGYISDMAREYHVAPAGGGRREAATRGSRLDFREGAFDPDHDGDDDSTAEGDTDHDYFSTDGRPIRPQSSMLKGAPFAGYKNFAECVARNQDKNDPSAYCGEIKHRAEGAVRAQGASSLPQLQQVTDPDNGEDPQGDQLPEGVMFPVGDGFARQWVTGPAGAQPRGQREGARTEAPSPDAARMFGRMDAMDERPPQHKDSFAFSSIQHGRYLKGYNEVAGWVHAMSGRAPMSRGDYGSATGRPDLHAHYLASYAEGRKAHHGLGSQEAALRATADTMSAPHATTDDLAAPYNSPATTPPMTQPGGDYAAGLAAGKADKAAGQRPAFADNSSGVSPYVKGYAEGFGGAQAPAQPQDVPYSTGGDSGQAAGAQQAAQSFQVARASRRRASASFAPQALFNDADFSKGYNFASMWKPGHRLVSQGSARFEAGLYAGMTDAAPSVQRDWLSAHASGAGSHPRLGRRIALHRSFTRKHARRHGLRAQGAYVRAAGTSTDLITDGPGTSPDPMGATPLNGPGTPPPMGGRGDANAPGGAPPYQGAPPLPGGPVVPDDVMGRPQQAAQPSGPFTQTFSGTHPGNATLAPAAPNSAAQPGYSNKDAYDGDPRGGDRTARLAAFRDRVQAGLAMMGAQ